MALAATRMTEAIESAAAFSIGLPAEKIHILEALSRYWPRNRELIAAFQSRLPPLQRTRVRIPPKLAWIRLPAWAQDLGIDGKLAMPEDLLEERAHSWESAPWLEAAFWLLSALPEQARELQRGPIYSRSERLGAWPAELWERAWVNRIALFIRRWAARNAGEDEATLFGGLPSAEITIAYQVAEPVPTSRLQWMVNWAAWRLSLDQLTRMPSWSRIPRRAAFFPSSLFNEKDGRARHDIARAVIASGALPGALLSSDCPIEPLSMQLQRERLEAALGMEARLCLTEGLRFTWQNSWVSQAAAGFTEDYSLGFADRPGFRNSSALVFSPWLFPKRATGAIRAVPAVATHEQPLPRWGSRQSRRLAEWIEEIRFVRGVACIHWPAQLSGGSASAAEHHLRALTELGLSTP